MNDEFGFRAQPMAGRHYKRKFAGKIPAVANSGDFSRKGFRKKRGRKEDLLLNGAAHGFRALHGYNLPVAFEQPITKLKTKFDDFVNISWAGKLLFTRLRTVGAGIARPPKNDIFFGFSEGK